MPGPLTPTGQSTARTSCPQHNTFRVSRQHDVCEERCDFFGVDLSPNNRLLIAREALGLSRDQVAERLGRSVSGIGALENGQNGVRSEVAERLAPILKAAPEWLLFGRGPPPDKYEEALRRFRDGEFDRKRGATGRRSVARPRLQMTPIAIISWVSAGRLQDVREPTPEEADKYVCMEGSAHGDYFGLVVDGDSMDRVSPPGSVIIVDRGDREPRAGLAYVFGRLSETTFKRYQSDPIIRLEPDSTNGTNKIIFPRKDDEWTVIGRVRRTVLDL